MSTRTSKRLAAKRKANGEVSAEATAERQCEPLRAAKRHHAAAGPPVSRGADEKDADGGGGGPERVPAPAPVSASAVHVHAMQGRRANMEDTNHVSLRLGGGSSTFCGTPPRAIHPWHGSANARLFFFCGRCV